MEHILSTTLFVLIGLLSTGWLLMRSARAVRPEEADPRWPSRSR